MVGRPRVRHDKPKLEWEFQIVVRAAHALQPSHWEGTPSKWHRRGASRSLLMEERASRKVREAYIGADRDVRSGPFDGRPCSSLPTEARSTYPILRWGQAYRASRNRKGAQQVQTLP
jgi:hypothetical protein